MDSEPAANVQWMGPGRVIKGSGERPPSQGPPRVASADNSRRRLLWVLGFLACTAVSLNVKLILDLSDGTHRTAISKELRPQLDLDGESSLPGNTETFKTLDALRNRLLILLGITMVCFGSFVYVLLSKFLAPLAAIGRGAREIAAGNLAVTVPGGGEDELGKLGAAVNDIAVNYQEILLLAGTQAGKCLAALERIEKTVQEGSTSEAELLEHTLVLKNELALLRDVVREFRFYDAYFDGRKVVRNDPGMRG